MLEVLSLGAGVQSTAVLLMSIKGELPKIDHAIFADTGWEPKEVYDNLEWIIKEVDGKVPIHVVRHGNIRDDHTSMSGRTTMPFYVDTGSDDGGITRRKCTREYKADPIDKFIRREILGLKHRQRAPTTPVVRHWFGISTDEFRRVRTSKNKWRTFWYPLIEHRFSRNSCLDWMLDNEYPTPPRSACIGCPFHSPAEWRRLKNNSPDDFEDACKFDETMRDNPGMTGRAYLHNSLVPLREIDFSNDVDRGQQLLWQDECEGMCGL